MTASNQQQLKQRVAAAALERVREITDKPLEFVRCDLLDRAGLERVFVDFDIDAVIHFAGLKAVGESVEKPLTYYRNNVCGTANLLEAMAAANVRDLVFSSSCTVHGAPATLRPLSDISPVSSDTTLNRAPFAPGTVITRPPDVWPRIARRDQDP